jgi:hypothetical protein
VKVGFPPFGTHFVDFLKGNWAKGYITIYASKGISAEAWKKPAT